MADEPFFRRHRSWFFALKGDPERLGLNPPHAECFDAPEAPEAIAALEAPEAHTQDDPVWVALNREREVTRPWVERKEV